MTDQGPSFMPRQPVPPEPITLAEEPATPAVPSKLPYGMSLGVHHNVETMQDDVPRPTPENITLDETPPDTRPIVGWRVKDAEGNTVAEMHNVNTRDYQKSQVDQVGASLDAQAVTPEDKEAAARAHAYMLSLVGILPAAEITKRGIAQYDQDSRNGISRNIQLEKSKRAALMGKGGGVSTKAAQHADKVELDDAKFAEDLLNKDQERSKIATLNDDLSTLDQMEAQASASNALSQRGSIAEYLKTLTGKQSTDAERNQILGAGGMIAKLQSALNLWNPEDASMSKQYIKLFVDNLHTIRAAIIKRKQALGAAAADHLKHNPRFIHKDQATKDELGRYGQGVVTGDYGDTAFDPSLLK